MRMLKRILATTLILTMFYCGIEIVQRVSANNNEVIEDENQIYEDDGYLANAQEAEVVDQEDENNLNNIFENDEQIPSMDQDIQNPTDYLIENAPQSLLVNEVQTTSEQGTNISDINVTGVTITPEKVADGSNTTIQVNFSDANGSIKGGDYIDVNWPSSGAVYLTGYSKTIPLYVEVNDQSIDVGNATVTGSGAKIVFNDQINNLRNITGNVHMTVICHNETNTNEIGRAHV